MRGLGVSQGIAIGKALVIDKNSIKIEKINIINTDNELNRFRQAIDICRKQINDIYFKALKELGDNDAQVFNCHLMILDDEAFISDVEKRIMEHINAEYAINEVAKLYINLFEEIQDEYLRERADDIRDVVNRMTRILLGLNMIDFSKINHNSIIVAKNLTPSHTVQLDKSKVMAMITELGGQTSHAAIIARNMGIPTVVGIDGILDKINNNDLVICDGKTGRVIVNPTTDQIRYYVLKMKKEQVFKNELKKQIGLPTITRDNFKVELSCNIGEPSDVTAALQNDAEGIGLFRSEFIFMNRDNEPSEEEQFKDYKQVLEKMNNKPVIIRTLDIGGDKDIPYIDFPEEINPFLGYRAIRMCLGNIHLFKTQLRAILRASIFGNVKIMFPMISTLKEIREAKEIFELAKKELFQESIPFNPNIEIGIMIEIPSAAIMSDLLAKEVDFFSIGTNDLIQYTFAVDRMNPRLSHLYSQYHPALLKLIYTTIKNAKNAGIWVGMCGEAAGDSKLIPVFIGMGIDELSMNANSILKSRYIIRNIYKKDMKEVTQKVLNMGSSEEVERYLNNLFPEDN